MNLELFEELRRNLATSDARVRKHWAAQIVETRVPLIQLMPLLHQPGRTGQRFTWLIGDLLETERSVVADCLPMIFDLRDDMPFPGMRRTVAKCLWFLGVPRELENEAIPQLFKWLDDNAFAVGVKHFAAKSLFDLAQQNRIDPKILDRVLEKQTRHETPAHAARMAKLRAKLTIQ